MKVICKILLIIPLVIISGCDEESLQELFSSYSPECGITSLEKYDEEPGKFTRFVITVENFDNSSVAYNAGCSVKLKVGNTIIDKGDAYFGDLNPGEAAVDEAWFSNIQTNSEYDYAEITLFWYDANNEYYEKDLTE